MKKHSYLGNIDVSRLEAYYQEYLKDPELVEPGWRHFFNGFEFARTQYPRQDSIPDEGRPVFEKEMKVLDLINAYRERGHLFTKTNPVRTRRSYSPTLIHQNFGLQDDDMNNSFEAGSDIGIGKAPLKDIIGHLKQTYCQSVGAEYMYIRSPEIVDWLKERMESTKNSQDFSVGEKKQILGKLIEAVSFEQFLSKRFPGQKRFSLEGCEALIPALDAAIEKGAEMGIREYVIGMAHRGRLNVLGNILRKPYRQIFSEFEGKEYADDTLLGDVKYHLGCTLETTTRNGHKINLSIAPNPSHLESVYPVAEGITRAKIDLKHEGDNQRVVPVMIHGDASIAGQGVVYELLQMSQLKGYQTGGTIHLVINNQLGFTTNYLDGRSSTYCTDVAKTIQAPIFHVNGDDVEAVVYTIQLAMDFRQRFKRDVFVDLLSYRKYGHNESDEPRFTQPILYKIIEKHPDPATIYIKKLTAINEISEQQIHHIRNSFGEMLEKELDASRQIQKGSIDPFLANTWREYPEARPEDMSRPTNTSFDEPILNQLAERITRIPEEKGFFRKTLRMMRDRHAMFFKGLKVDWAMAETLAYASLLHEGVPVRVSGQDVERGTFSHRHAVLKIEDSEEEFVPLSNIGKHQAQFEIYNSPLSEYGVLGFEYGYAMAGPGKLVVWEAQFGDFVNGAQIIIDQYLASAEEKWKTPNGLVLLLPHGYEGQGPEHSSARMERFLGLCAENNMQLANCTTPANFFHLMRRQMKRPFRKPLVVFTPKSLLRHPQCVSATSELTTGSFQPLIDDPQANPEITERVILCSGKIYYDLKEEKEKNAMTHTAIVRIEQLYPLPEKSLQSVKKKYKKAKRWLWVQEEPENMGAWTFMMNSLKDFNPGVIARPPSGSPASGSSKFHVLQQQKIVEKAFEECDCENVCINCKQLCISHLTEIS